MTIQLFKLDNSQDAALVVNGQIVASVDTSFDEDGSIGNLESIAERLAGAIDCGLQVIDSHPTPDAEDWTWDDILSANSRKASLGM